MNHLVYKKSENSGKSSPQESTVLSSDCLFAACQQSKTQRFTVYSSVRLFKKQKNLMIERLEVGHVYHCCFKNVIYLTMKCNEHLLFFDLISHISPTVYLFCQTSKCCLR